MHDTSFNWLVVGAGGPHSKVVKVVDISFLDALLELLAGSCRSGHEFCLPAQKKIANEDYRNGYTAYPNRGTQHLNGHPCLLINKNHISMQQLLLVTGIIKSHSLETR